MELEGESIAELGQRLASDPLVTSVRAEQRAEFRLNPNDPAFLYHDPNAPLDDFAQWHLAYQGFPRAWELGRGVGGEVAVLDSGVYVPHPDLAGRILGAVNCAGLVSLGGDVSDESGHGPTSPGSPARTPTAATASPRPGSTAPCTRSRSTSASPTPR